MCFGDHLAKARKAAGMTQADLAKRLRTNEKTALCRGFCGRSYRIRTCDLLLPRQARYQAALNSDKDTLIQPRKINLTSLNRSTCIIKS